MIFFSGSAAIVSPQLSPDRVALLDTNVDHSIQMTIRGPIVADETFRSYQVKISPATRTLITNKGYQNQPTNNVSLINSVSSYEQFVYALDKADLIKGVELTGERNDTRGICATGFIYDFQVLSADKPVERLWTSSCSGSRGSLNANLDQLTNLFKAQIPGIQLIIGDLWQ
jgi:hypothetical protein